jgi:ABC-2 type transport system permease protein
MQSVEAVYAIWKREMIRWWRDKLRIVGSLSFPLIFLFVFGSGLSGAMGSLIGGEGGGPSIDFKQFIFPGIIGFNVLIGAVFNGISLVQDREYGVLKEVIVAPINRAAVALGKTLGGATVASLQGSLVLLLAPLVGIQLTVTMVLQILPVMLLGAFALSSMGVALAARMSSTQGFQLVSQFVIFPLVFLSGVFFPLQGLPTWMSWLVQFNPVSYAIDPLRRIVLGAQGVTSEAFGQAGLGITIGDHVVTLTQSLLVVAVFGLLMNAIAMWLVSIQD